MTQDRSSLIPMKGALFVFLLTMGLTLPWVGSTQTNAIAVTNPVISVTPTNLNFGIIGVGRTKDLVVRIENVGGGTLAGSASAKEFFSVVSGGTYHLTNHQSQTVTIRYNPKAVGDFAQKVNFSGGGSLNITAQGRAAVPPAPPQNLHIVNVSQ